MEINCSYSKIKYWKKFKLKKYRDEIGLFLIEGEHLVEEALKHKIVKEVIREITLDVKDYGVPVFYVTKDMMKKISSMKSTPHIMALCYKPLEGKIGNKIIILDNIQDPGNLGTIIRSAVAFNFDSIVLSDNTVDLYNEKVIRSTQGMIFNINIVRRELEGYILDLRNYGYKIYGTSIDNTQEIKEIKSQDKYAIIIGNEGNGISKDIINLCDEIISISINPLCESLNAAVAAGIIMYEMSTKNE